jgi:hypothetical protein
MPPIIPEFMRLIMLKYPWAFTVAIAATVFLGAVLLAGRDATLGVWGVRCLKPDFSDTRGITSGVEAWAAGEDPLVSNPRDPWARTFNYPRAWLALSWFGVTQDDSVWIGYVLTGLFFVGLAIFPPADPGGRTIGMMLCGAFSPAVLLGLERGNSDLLMFFLLATAITAFSGSRRAAKAVGTVALLAAFVLKIYPLLGAAMILGESRKVFLRFTVGITLFASFILLWTRADIALIHAATPRATGLSYGIDVLWMEIGQHGERLGDIAWLLSRAGVLVAAALLAAGFLRKGEFGDVVHGCGKTLAAFQAGAAVYCGTFLLGNNWDYRLVFLLFTFPFLSRAAGTDDRRVSWISIAVLANALASLWHVTIHHAARNFPFGSEASVLLDEACNWFTFLGLGFLLGLTMPDWLRRKRWRASDAFAR